MVTKTQKLKVLSSESMYQGRVFGVRRDHVIEPNGVNATRDVVTHSGSVVILPVFADGRILLIRQYRYSARAFLWELVAWPAEKIAAQKRTTVEVAYDTVDLVKSHQFIGPKP